VYHKKVGTSSTCKDFFVTLAAGVFIGAVCFDILPEVTRELSIVAALGFVLLGFALWIVFKITADHFSRSGLAVVSALAFWFHSFLEGTVTALSFAAGLIAGLIVALGMLLHLVPEFFAITAVLKGEGVSTKRSVSVDIGGIAILFASFTVMSFVIRGFNANTLGVLAAISGGAFLYIGAASFLKRPKTKVNIGGLLIGLLVVAAWSAVFKI
jgi:zinc transporter ZupT